jgi:hypothetical protein
MSPNGPKRTFAAPPMNVRFRGKSGHRALLSPCLLLTQSGHGRLRIAAVQLDP